MSYSERISTLELEQWREVAATAIGKLPPDAVDRLNNDSEKRAFAIENLAKSAWNHFLYLRVNDPSFVESASKEFRENLGALFKARKRIVEHLEFLVQAERHPPDLWSREIKMYEIAAHAIEMLIDHDAKLETFRQNAVPSGNTSHDPSMKKFIHDLLLDYLRLVHVAPADLKLSGTVNKKTYLMNFLITMVRPIPKYKDLEDGDLARRIYRIARPILRDEFSKLPDLPAKSLL